MCMLISGLHRASANAKPFNPILGETFEAAYEDGTRVRMEQCSHHPPISAFQLTGPPAHEGGPPLFEMYGTHEFTASFRPNGVVGQQLGATVVRFSDGGAVTFLYPQVWLKGLVWGDRHFTWHGDVAFTYTEDMPVAPVHFASPREFDINRMPPPVLRADLTFNPDDQNALVGLFRKQRTPIDSIRGTIVQLRAMRAGHAVPAVPAGHQAPKARDGAKPLAAGHVLVSQIDGSWLDGIRFDGVEFWRRCVHRPFFLQHLPDEDVLPSDSRFREDLQHLKRGDLEGAQKWKAALEVQQRDDKKLRKNAEKHRPRPTGREPSQSVSQHPQHQRNESGAHHRTDSQ
jgi:hypothetical protein